MRTVIIEDESQAVIALKEELKTNCPDLDICGNAGTLSAAKKLIIEKKPELVFLDIQLKDGNSFDLLSKIGKYNFKIIFTTAYSHYALNAIKISALDYLLKPIDSLELVNAVNKAKQSSFGNMQIQLQSFIQNQQLNTLRKKIAIQTSKGFFLHELETIVRLQSDGNYTSIYLTNGKKLLVAKILKDFEELLTNLGFIRIHHSHIINLNHMESYINKDGGYVVLNDKTNLPVSKRKKSDLLNLLNSLN